MNELEKAARKHAADWKKLEKSGQIEKERIEGIAKRAKIDKALGHSPKCTLTKCHPDCKAK